MSKPALRFATIAARRLPGFPQGGPRLAELSPGINLVYGPNGAGKSSLVRAARALLWPELLPAASGAELAATFEVGAVSFQLELEAGRTARYERDGAPGPPPPGLPPASLADRYDLALETLLAARGEPLAGEIQREVAGGFDLAAARDRTGFRAQPSQPRQRAGELERAEQRVAEISREQEALLLAERGLAALHQRREAAAEARRRAEELARTLELARAQAQRADLAARLEAFAPLVARLQGDEGERLDRLEARRAAAAVALAQLDAELSDAAEELAGLGPADGPSFDDEALATLRARLEQLRQVDGELAHGTTSVAAAEARLARSLAAFGEVGGEPPSPPLANLPATAPQRLASLLQGAEETRAEARLAERAASLQRLAAAQFAAPADLLRGLGLLSRGLARGGGPWRLLALAGLALGAGWASVALARLGSLAWLAGLAAGLVALGLLGREALALRDRRQLAAELRALGLEAPEDWRPANVEARQGEILRRLATANSALAAREVWQGLGIDAERLAHKEAALAARCAELSRELGLPVAPPLLHLSFLAERLRDATEAGDALAAERAGLAPLRAEREALAGELTAALQPTTGNDTAALAAALAARERRLRQAATLAERIAGHRRALDKARWDLAEVDREEQALWQQLALPAADRPQLASALAELPAYRDLAKELLRAEGTLVSLTASSAETTALAASDPAALEAELAASQAAAAEEADLQREITALSTRLADARQKHDLEAALASRDAAREALEADRQADLARLAGWLLAERLQAELAERSQPRVLRRAEEIFAAITRDRYQLRTLAGSPPTLHAIERSRRVSLELAQLSGGTRVQLLLAVRLGFLEQQEPAVALPLFLDETLATSDLERATAVIEAVATFADAGRQVFVLTAQESEVVLWLNVLERLAREGLAVPRQSHDLSELRRGAHRERFQLAPPTPTAAPPAIAGQDHASYAAALGVPPFDPRHQEVSELPLWYLSEDLPLLHRLVAGGYERWGPLAGLLDRGMGEAIAPASGAALTNLAATAKAVEAAVAAYRVGRGPRVDRATLLASGAVSERFLDEVAALAAAVDGAAGELVARLEAGAVKGFRGRKLEELADDLERSGHLDRRPAATADDVRLAALAAAQPALAAGALHAADLQRTLSRIGLL